MYIGKWINIETIAKLKYYKAVPFTGLDSSEMWYQMNAINNRLNLNDAGRPVTILH